MTCPFLQVTGILIIHFTLEHGKEWHLSGQLCPHGKLRVHSKEQPPFCANVVKSCLVLSKFSRLWDAQMAGNPSNTRFLTSMLVSKRFHNFAPFIALVDYPWNLYLLIELSAGFWRNLQVVLQRVLDSN